MRKYRNGFTLIEILITMGIIGILMVIAITAAGSARTRSRDVQRKSNVMSIANALETYKSANGVYAPSLKNDACSRASRLDLTGLGDCFYNINNPSLANGQYEPMFTPNGAKPDATNYLSTLVQLPKVITSSMASNVGSFPDNTSNQGATTIPYSSGTINYRAQSTYYMVRIALEDKSTAGTPNSNGTCAYADPGNGTAVLNNDNWRDAIYAVSGASNPCGAGSYKIFQKSSLTSIR